MVHPPSSDIEYIADDMSDSDDHQAPATPAAARWAAQVQERRSVAEPKHEKPPTPAQCSRQATAASLDLLSSYMETKVNTDKENFA